MKYLILIYRNPQSLEIFGAAELRRELQAYARLNEDLSASGELIVTEALADASLGKRVSLRESRPLTTDGPFAETKEELAGLYLVECDSLDRAVEIAARIPQAQLGLVEVRPTMAYREMDV